jgi:GT2 family glycosyltransferase
MKPTVAVVILNWNGRHWLEKFLPFVVKTTYQPHEIIIADNASTDDSIDFLKKNYPHLRIILNSENGGFAKGYNDALSKVEADYYILLNSDIETPASWIEPVIELMEGDEMIAVAQPKILMYDNKELFEYAGASGGYIDMFGYPFCRGRIFDSLEKDAGQYQSAQEVFWATGACLFIRASLFHQLGGFYEPLFAHMEEIDLCWRLKNIGYKIYVCPESHVYHVGGGTLPKSSPFKTYLNYRNGLIIMQRNLTFSQKIYIMPIRWVLDVISQFKLLFEGKTGEFKAIFKAHSHYLLGILKWARNKGKKNKSNKAGIYHGSIVWAYFGKGKKFFNQYKF